MGFIFETYLLNICLIPSVLLIILIFQYVISFSYWKSRNIPFISPKFPFGSVHLLPNQKFYSAEWFTEMYKATRVLKEKYMGLFIFMRPILVVADPDLIESVLVKDAKYFQEHDVNLHTNIFNEAFYSFTGEQLQGNFTNLAFEKMNAIFHMTLKYFENLGSMIEDYVLQDEPINMTDTFEKLTIRSLSDTNTEFRKNCMYIDSSTVSKTLNYCLYELSKNRTIQNKLRDEIKTSFYKNNNQISYDDVIDMKYLEQTINETLRKYPPIPLLKKELKENYTIPGTNAIIQKGIQLWIPILGLHNDIWHYPEPEVFNPDRFTDEEQIRRHPFTYLPFGNDPRISLDLKLRILQVKVPLIILLKTYSYSIDPVMKQPHKFMKTAASPTPQHKIYLQVKRI